MIIATNQPYFCPFPGLFYKALLADVLVILDSVQFPQGTTWITRNRFKNDQGTLWMTIPVWKKGLGLQKINEVRICHEGRWAKKHLASLMNAYAHAPYFVEHQNFMQSIFSSRFEKLIDLNLEIINYLMRLLHIDTKVILLSELGISSTGDQLLIDICNTMKASHFLAQKPAGKHLDVERFRKAGIELTYVHYPSLIYPQLWGDFIPNLSTFDLVFTCGPKARNILIENKP